MAIIKLLLFLLLLDLIMAVILKIFVDDSEDDGSMNTDTEKTGNEPDKSDNSDKY